MFKKSIIAIILLILLTKISSAKESLNASEIAQNCYSVHWHKQALLDLAKRNFAIENQLERSELARQLLKCLAISDGRIRDGVAFAGLSSWLRANKLPVEVHSAMFESLIKHFAAQTHDENGVYQPFIALVLAELARVDRKSPYLTPEQMQQLVIKSTAYMVNIKDYRAFDNIVGWRHNVAHTADIFLQLALNPAINKEQLTMMLNAIGQQALAQNTHFYTYGEPERLATALLYILLQKQHSEKDWKNWLQKYITPAPMTDWQQVYISQQGLAKLHNARALLGAIFVLIADSKNEQLQVLKPALVEALDNLP